MHVNSIFRNQVVNAQDAFDWLQLEHDFFEPKAKKKKIAARDLDGRPHLTCRFSKAFGMFTSFRPGATTTPGVFDIGLFI